MIAVSNNFANDLKKYFEECKIGLKKESGEVLTLQAGLGSLVVEETSEYFIIQNANAIDFPYILVDLADSLNKINKFVIFNQENQAVLEINASPPFVLLSGDRLTIPANALKIFIDKDGV